jgi:NAD(P)-dependent dehydrogenase (short-subunit alcohol dehydrogenase family)
LAIYPDLQDMAGYTACKSGVLGLTRSLARDCGAHGIRANAVAPGWLMTRLQPHEVAKFVVFLASAEASACTGQHDLVDGGWA